MTTVNISEVIDATDVHVHCLPHLKTSTGSDKH